MKDIALTAADWKMLHDLKEMFGIFDKPTRVTEASRPPTLNLALSLYLKMMSKLDAIRDKLGWQSTIGVACTEACDKLDFYYT